MQATFDERREYSRFHRDPVACTVTVDGNSQQGFIVEESIGGLRVSGLRFDRLRINQHITIQSEDQIINGQCRNLDFDESGKFAIGIRCVENGMEAELGGQLLAFFLKHDDKSFVCTPLEIGTTRCRVRLVDGKEFTLSRDLMEHKPRSKRRSELLGDLSFLKTLARFYRIKDTNPPRSHDEWIDEIIDHEFRS